ncbi:MAG TPA: MarR family transcriptional regulator [Candidatus Nanopelagicales bacterium]|jgi:DNA-binding MarR family transcriptional regulator
MEIRTRATTQPDQLNSAVTRLFVRLREHLVDQGASVPAVRVLAQLRDRGPSRVTVLATALQVSQPTMTQQLHRLAEQGRIVRTIDAGDGRAVRAELTDKGRAVLDSLVASRSALLVAGLDQLDERDRDAIAAATPALARLAEALESPLTHN